MKDIFKTLGETFVAMACCHIQLIAIFFGGFGMLFVKIADLLHDCNLKILEWIGKSKKKSVTK